MTSIFKINLNPNCHSEDLFTIIDQVDKEDKIEKIILDDIKKEIKNDLVRDSEIEVDDATKLAIEEYFQISYDQINNKKAEIIKLEIDNIKDYFEKIPQIYKTYKMLSPYRIKNLTKDTKINLTIVKNLYEFMCSDDSLIYGTITNI